MKREHLEIELQAQQAVARKSSRLFMTASALLNNEQKRNMLSAMQLSQVLTDRAVGFEKITNSLNRIDELVDLLFLPSQKDTADRQRAARSSTDYRRANAPAPYG
jgi:hypothetical protein